LQLTRFRPKETYDQFNTNVFGTLNVTRVITPYMREQHSGLIATFGSLGSWRSGPAFGLYAATKWACSAIGEGLRTELAPFGINALVIEPGYFRSNFLNADARIRSEKRIEAYDATAVGQVRRTLDQVNNNQPGDVARGCKVIVDVLTQDGVAKGKEIPLRLCLGSDIDATIRGKIQETEKLLDEWHDVIFSTDYPKGE
jgi:NAD(P)-dependent dehydrogenase (short-subunit alcohol dehydrogenase family)